MQDNDQPSWPTIVSVLALGWLAGFAVGKIPPAIPLLREEFGLSLVAAAWLSSLVSVTSAIAAFMIGALADRVHPQRVMIVGVACLGLGSLLGLGTVLSLLFFSRVLESIGFVIIAVGGPRLLRAALAGAPGGAAFGAWATYLPGGAALAMFLCPWFFPAVGWRGLWIFNIALIVAVSVPAMIIIGRNLSRVPQASSPSRLSESLGVLRLPALWLLGGCFGCYTLQFFAVITFLPTFLIEELQYPEKTAALLTALVMAVNVIGAFLGGWFLQKGIAATTQIAVTLILLGLAGIGLFASFAPDWIRMPSVLFLSTVGGIIPGAVFASVNEVMKDARQLAAANGIVVQGSTLGNLLGPPILAAALPVLGGWQNSWILLLIFAAAGLLATLLLRQVMPSKKV